MWRCSAQYTDAAAADAHAAVAPFHYALLASAALLGLTFVPESAAITGPRGSETGAAITSRRQWHQCFEQDRKYGISGQS